MKSITSTTLFISCLAFILIMTSCGLSSEEIEKMNIAKNVDLSRYAGKWYEIARFPHSFEKDLVGVTATYTLRTDGKINVLNEGYKNSLDGKYKKAKATARVPDPAYPGWLKVVFFWPFAADYLILELDDKNYQYALVGSSSDNFLWILCRTPQMDEATYSLLVGKANERGYDITRLEKVPQKTK